MWIRSQNKIDLIDITGERFYIRNQCVWIDFLDGSEDGCLKLGMYNSHERALQVLDEIQNQLTSISHIQASQADTSGGWLTTEHSEVIYQMPAE